MDDKDLLLRVHDPVVRHARLAQRPHLVNEIWLLVRGREELAHPVRPDLDWPSRRALPGMVPPPTGNIVAVELLVPVLDVDLGAEPPASRPAPTRLPIK